MFRDLRYRAAPRSAFVGLSVLALAIGLPAATLAGPNPVTSSVAPDPSVVRAEDGSFHVFASSDNWGDGGGVRELPHFRSFVLVEWQYVGDALPAAPTWTAPGTNLWAPDVHTNPDGSLRMYYTTGGDSPCIGMATAPSVDGEWADLGRAIVCKQEGSPLDPMDPFVDFSGATPVMYMGNFEGIHAVRMNAEGTELAGEPVEVAGEGSEAPELVRRGDSSYLFLSQGNCCTGEDSRYHVVAGRSADPLGPFTDKQGTDLREGGGDTVLAGNAAWVGPGHPDVVTDDQGQDWMIYHAAPRGQATLPNGIQRRQLLVDRLDWVDGWPAVGADGTPSTERPTDPSVNLPVRLDRRGDATLTDMTGAPTLYVPAALRSTGQAYDGVVWASITGPDKQPVPVLLRSAPGADADFAFGADSPTLPASVAAGASSEPNYTVVLPAGLAEGQYELTLSIGHEQGAAQEAAVYGLKVTGAGVPVPDALGSLPLGSSGGGAPFGS